MPPGSRQRPSDIELTRKVTGRPLWPPRKVPCPQISRDPLPGLSRTGLGASSPRDTNFRSALGLQDAPPETPFKSLTQTTWGIGRTSDRSISDIRSNDLRQTSSWEAHMTNTDSIKPVSSYFYWNQDIHLPPLINANPAFAKKAKDNSKLLRQPRKTRKSHPWWSEFSMAPTPPRTRTEKISYGLEYFSPRNATFDTTRERGVIDFTKNTTTLPDITKNFTKRANISISHYHADCLGSDDEFDISWTLPRVEAVLRSEGIHTGSIAHELAKLKAKRSKEYDEERRYQIKSKPPRPLETSPENNMEILVDDPEQCQAKKDFDDYSRDIDHIRWLSEQQIERGTLDPEVSLPRVVVISSHVPRSEHLVSAITDSTILFVCYNYSSGDLNGILSAIRTILDEYHEGYRMRSLLLYCLGGPGFIYLLKKKVLTRPKLLGDNHRDLVDFLKGLGNMMSKIDPNNARIHILGCGHSVDEEDSATQLVDTMSTAAYPSVVHFEVIDEMSDHGKEVLEMYFNYNRFYEWKYEEPED